MLIMPGEEILQVQIRIHGTACVGGVPSLRDLCGGSFGSTLTASGWTMVLQLAAGVIGRSFPVYAVRVLQVVKPYTMNEIWKVVVVTIGSLKRVRINTNK